MKNTIGKLTVFKPDILLVEKTVSRLAQEMLLSLGVTVALNVKPVRNFFKISLSNKVYINLNFNCYVIDF